MKKPKVKVIGQDGNVFSILARCTLALKRQDKTNGKALAEELSKKVFQAGSYDNALSIMSEYVTFT